MKAIQDLGKSTKLVYIDYCGPVRTQWLCNIMKDKLHSIQYRHIVQMIMNHS